MPRDNLLNSACLELFEFVRKETIKPVVLHLGANHREKLQDITYVDTFSSLLIRYDQLTTEKPEIEHTLLSQDDDSPSMNRVHVNGRWQGIPEMDASEEDYFNTSDDDDDPTLEEEPVKEWAERMQWHRHQKRLRPETTANGGVSKPKLLVDYPDDDEDELMDAKSTYTPQTPLTPESEKENSPNSRPTLEKRLQPSPDIKSAAESELQHPPERLTEKRRRQEDEEEDELGKLSTGTKRRNSSSSNSSLASLGSVKRKKSFLRSKQADDPHPVAPRHDNENHVDVKRPRKIAISLPNTPNTKADEAAKKQNQAK